MTKRLLATMAALVVLFPALATVAGGQAHAQTTDSRLIVYGEVGEFISGGMDLTFAESDGATLSATNDLSLIHISEPTRPY